MKYILLFFLTMLLIVIAFDLLTGFTKKNQLTPSIIVQQIQPMIQKNFSQLDATKIVPTNTPIPTPTIDLAKYGPCKSVPVLMYHHVNSYTGDQKTSSSLTVTDEMFTKQMDYLASKSYQTISPYELLNGLTNNSLPVKPIVITFDDAYEDNFTQAYPILKNHNFKFTIFIPTGLIDSSSVYLNWQQLKDMQSSGLLTAGAHTWSHKALTAASGETLAMEVALPKKQLEENLGGNITAFAYPFGSDNAKAETELQKDGYQMSFLTTRGIQCAKLPFEFHRIRIGNSQLSSYGL